MKYHDTLMYMQKLIVVPNNTFTIDVLASGFLFVSRTTIMAEYVLHTLLNEL